MNDDRISELYKGEILTSAAQERARRRINWLVSYAEGGRVLDIGCSQGIASILLGREGFDVVGVDVQRSRIDYALADLAKEEAETRARVTFETGNGADLPFADDSFDTVLLGEVLEHLAQPDQVLTEAIRVAGPKGVVLVTTPVGLHPHHDHKQTFRPKDVIDLFRRAASVQHITIVDGYFRAVLRHPDVRGLTDEKALLSLQGPLAEMLLAVQETAFNAHKAERSAARRKVELQRELQQRTKDHEQQIRKLTDDIQRLQSKVNMSSSQWTEERNQLTKQLLKMQGELKKEQGRSSRVSRLKRDVVRLRYERDVAQWKHRSLRARKWWRIGVALGTLRRRPLAVISVLTQVIRIALGPSQSNTARPARPPDLSRSGPKIPNKEGSTSELPILADCSPIPARMIVAAIALDPIVESQFSFEWVSQPIKPQNWREVLHEGAPDLLIVSDTGWKEQLDPSTPTTQLKEMVDAFRTANVPTIYWDTSRGEVTAARVSVARLFDIVVCSFPTAVDAYRSLRHQDAYLFTPAVQTRLFSPLLEGRGGGDVISLRSTQVPDGKGSLTRAARKAAPHSLSIEETDESDGLSRKGGAALAAKGYKAAVVELPQSPDEWELRRLLEVVATKTPLVIGGALPDELADLAIGAATNQEPTEILRTLLGSDGLREQMSHRAWRHILRHNSIRQRVDELLSLTGVSGPSTFPQLTFMVPTNRPHNLETILDNLGRQTYPEISAVLALHGVQIDTDRMRDMAMERGLKDIEVLHVSEDVALGEVFNRGFAACQGDFFGKMDDDDYYGPEYASDLMAAFEHTSADIVGKWTHYAYSQALDSTLLRYPGCEHSYQPLLAISTLILRPSVLESVSFLPMPRGSGSRFLREARADGAKVYSGDRFNYLYKRYSGNGHQHTWPMTDYEFAAKADFICQGKNLAVVDA